MAAGEKRALTPELREAYARSGTSHLLAVSGLHVGIVFLPTECFLIHPCVECCFLVTEIILENKPRENSELFV